jgi:hypothetical protein
MALAETHIGRTQSETQTGEVQSVLFDDFVAGKGRGLTVLLQYDSPLMLSEHTNL